MFRNKTFTDFVEKNGILKEFFEDGNCASAMYVSVSCDEMFLFRNGRRTMSFVFSCGHLEEVKTYRLDFAQVLEKEKVCPLIEADTVIIENN